MPRLYRESPLNSIWEGSGNVQCLDVLRAMVRGPEAVEAFFAEVDEARGAEPRLDAAADELRAELGDLEAIESRARRVVERMALVLQGSLRGPLRRPGGRRRLLRLAPRRRLGAGVRHPAGRHRLRAHHRAPRGVLLADDALRAHRAATCRGNLVGYLALFVALSGTALALPGKNSVKSERHRPRRGQGQGDRRRRGAARRSSATAAVSSATLDDGSVIDGDLADGAVTGAEARRRLRSTRGEDRARGRSTAASSPTARSTRRRSTTASLLGRGLRARASSATGSLTRTSRSGDRSRLPRAGRLFVTATLRRPTCARRRARTYVVRVDGVRRAGHPEHVAAATTSEQLTLVGSPIRSPPAPTTSTSRSVGRRDAHRARRPRRGPAAVARASARRGGGSTASERRIASASVS